MHLLPEGTNRAAGMPREILTPEVVTRSYGVPVAVQQLGTGHHVCVLTDLVD